MIRISILPSIAVFWKHSLWLKVKRYTEPTDTLTCTAIFDMNHISNIQSKQRFTVAFRGSRNQMITILLELLRHRNTFIEIVIPTGVFVAFFATFPTFCDASPGLRLFYYYV